jgi:hypothetical protein
VAWKLTLCVSAMCPAVRSTPDDCAQSLARATTSMTHHYSSNHNPKPGGQQAWCDYGSHAKRTPPARPHLLASTHMHLQLPCVAMRGAGGGLAGLWPSRPRIPWPQKTQPRRILRGTTDIPEPQQTGPAAPTQPPSPPIPAGRGRAGGGENTLCLLADQASDRLVVEVTLIGTF